MNLSSLEFGILIPAFMAGMLVLATHVPLGQQVLNRGIVFIDLDCAGGRSGRDCSERLRLRSRRLARSNRGS